MEENKQKNNKNLSGEDMVTTLDGRVVSKKDIKDGEIYINAEGKKVRKVVRKVAREEVPSQNVNNVGAVASTLQSVAVKKVEPKVAHENRNGDPKELMERVNARHSFLERMRKNEKIGVTKAPEIVQTQETTNGDLYEESIDEENIAPDRSVSQLESDVLDENYSNSIGGGTSYATSNIGNESKVSGLATNPNANPMAIMSQAGNPISQSLAGNQTAIPRPVNAKVEIKKPKKKRKPIKLWIPMVAIASVYVVACLVYFFTCYNFADKSVDIGKYYIAVGADSKKEYYDGQKFNFYELIMTYYWSDENVEEYDLTKFHMVEPTNSMGYTLNNGYISGIWDGDYADDAVAYRDVKVKFLYNEETCYVPVRIYKNILTSLNCYSSVQDLYGAKGGDTIAVTVFGVYTNKVMQDEGIGSIERKLDAGEYDLWIHVEGSDGLSGSSKLEYNEATKKYIVPSKIGSATIHYTEWNGGVNRPDDIKITATSVIDSNIKCYTYDKYDVSTYNTVQHIEESFTIRVPHSYLNENDSERDVVKNARFNHPFTFSIEPNETYRLRDGATVSYNVKDEDGNYVYENFQTLNADELGNYRVEREQVTGRVIIKVDGCSNKYTATFYTKDTLNSGYGVYTTAEFLPDNNITGISNPTDSDFFKFTGWKEKFADGSYGEIYTDLTQIVMGATDRSFEAQYEATNPSISYIGTGFSIVNNYGEPINEITYGEPLTFKLKLTDGYIVNGKVKLLYKTDAPNSTFTQIYPDGSNNEAQDYSEEQTYTINGSALNGNLTFDLNISYKINESEMFEVLSNQNSSKIDRIAHSQAGSMYIKIRLKEGYSAERDEQSLVIPPVISFNNGASQLRLYTANTTSEFVYEINLNDITQNITFKIESGVVTKYSVVAKTAVEDEVPNFKVMTVVEEGESTELTEFVTENEDLLFKIVPLADYKADNIVVKAKIGNTEITLNPTDSVYTLSNTLFNGKSRTIEIIVSGIEIDIPNEEPESGQE